MVPTRTQNRPPPGCLVGGVHDPWSAVGRHSRAQGPPKLSIRSLVMGPPVPRLLRDGGGGAPPSDELRWGLRVGEACPSPGHRSKPRRPCSHHRCTRQSRVKMTRRVSLRCLSTEAQRNAGGALQRGGGQADVAVCYVPSGVGQTGKGGHMFPMLFIGFSST